MLTLTWACVCDTKLFSPWFSVRPFKPFYFYFTALLYSLLTAALRPNPLSTLKVQHLLTTQSPRFAQVTGRFHACAASNVICECKLSTSFVTMSEWISYYDLKTTDVFIVWGREGTFSPQKRHLKLTVLHKNIKRPSLLKTLVWGSLIKTIKLKYI